MSKKQTILDFYIDNYNKYTTLYNKCAVFVENGHFMEIYGYKDTDPQFEVCYFLDLNVAKRDKSDEDSTYFGGVPSHSIKKYYKKLIANNYTIICINQFTKTPNNIEDMEKLNKNIERKVSKIISPGCALSEDINDDCTLGQSVLIGLLLDEDKDGELYSYIGVFDVNLGFIELESIYQELDDNNPTQFDNSNLFSLIKERLDGILYHEIIISYHSKRIINNDEIESFKRNCIEQLQLQYKLTHFNYIDQSKSYLFDKNFHEHYLTKTFPQYVNIYNNIYHNLDIENIEKECISNFIIINNFITDHDATLSSNLPKPTWKKNNNSLYLHTYNDVYQKLNIFESLGDNKKSLFHYIDFTKTGPGTKLLRERLQYPITDINELNKRYDIIEELRNASSLTTIEQNIKMVNLQRIYRRFNIGQLQPYEIPRAYEAHKNMIQIFKWLSENKSSFPKLNNIINDDELVNKIQVYNSVLESLFDINKCYKYSLQTLDDSLFIRGQFPEIDSIVTQIDNCKNIFTRMCELLNNLIEDKIPGGNHVSLVKGKEGYFFDMSKKKGTLLENIIKNLTIEIKNQYEEEIGISLNEIEFNNNNKSNTKVTFKNVNHIFQKIEFLTTILVCKTKEKYSQELKKLYMEFFSNTLEPAIKYITEIDCYYSCAKCSIVYNYSRPILVESDTSGITLEKVRHPIIERLSQNKGIEYVPNDIVLDEEHNYLLYGVNSVGKSSLLKSIALTVLMAQSGFYVSAKNCMLKPFRSVFTRTGNDDNLFVAHSSFVKEMVETKNIIKHADKNSLIIADELCASTEINSAVTIVSALLKIISERKTSFIFATHLFDLNDTEIVKSLLNLHCLHLKVRFENNILLFERTLTEGLPDNRLYGVLVANKVIGINEFETLTKTIMTNRITPSKSKYNSKLWLEKCAICEYEPKGQFSLPLDTHHIHMQCTANEEGFIEHYHKNELHNLVSLCKVCHQRVHIGEIVINGYKVTDVGRMLDWRIVNGDVRGKDNVAVVKKSDIDKEAVYKYYVENSYKPKKVICNEINEVLGIKVSYGTFSKIVSK